MVVIIIKLVPNMTSVSRISYIVCLMSEGQMSITSHPKSKCFIVVHTEKGSKRTVIRHLRTEATDKVCFKTVNNNHHFTNI